MSEIKYKIHVWANNATGKRTRFTKEMFFPYFLPIGYIVAFAEFAIPIKEAEIHHDYVIIRSSANAEYDAGELLREGFVEG